MKTTIVAFGIAVIALSASCTSNNQNQQAPSHKHEDGTAHANHEEAKSKPAQESFVAEKDSLKPSTPHQEEAHKEAAHEHHHEDGSAHKH